MGTKRTNTLAAAAYSLGVNEELLEGALPFLKNDAVGFGTEVVKNLTSKTNELKAVKACLDSSKEVNGEAALLGSLVEQLISRIRSTEQGKQFIACVAEEGETPNYTFVHRVEQQITRFKGARVRLSCEDPDSPRSE